MKNTIRRITCLMMVLVMFSMAGSTVFAANQCSSISGNSKYKSKVTFTVKTGKSIGSEYVKIQQSKGIMKYDGWLGKNKTFKCNGLYFITVTNLKTNKVESNYSWNDGSQKIKFKKSNCKYKVEILSKDSTYYQAKYWYKGFIKGWQKYATWKATKTKGINMCR